MVGDENAGRSYRCVSRPNDILHVNSDIASTGTAITTTNHNAHLFGVLGAVTGLAHIQ